MRTNWPGSSSPSAASSPRRRRSRRNWRKGSTDTFRCRTTAPLTLSAAIFVATSSWKSCQGCEDLFAAWLCATFRLPLLVETCHVVLGDGDDLLGEVRQPLHRCIAG